MPRIKKAVPAEKRELAPDTTVHVPIEEVSPAGGWVATPENDPLSGGVTTFSHGDGSEPASKLEESAHEEYREEDVPEIPETADQEDDPVDWLHEEDAPAKEEVAPPSLDDLPMIPGPQMNTDYGTRPTLTHNFPTLPVSGQVHPVFGARLGDAEFVGKYEDGTPEWHAARAKGIGSSDAACLFNVGFKSAHVLWLEKKGYIEPEDLDANPIMREILLTGHLREPEIAEKFRLRHPEWSVHEGGSWRKAEAPWMLNNPDRILLNEATGEIAILEIKSSESGTGYDEGKVPSKYVVQVRHQLWTMGLGYGFLAVCIGNSDYREYFIPADPSQDIVRLYARGNSREIRTQCHYGDGLTMQIAQYNFLMAETPPPYSDGDDIYKLLRQRNPSLERNTEVEIPIEIASEFLQAKAAITDAEARLSWAKNHMMAHLGTKHFAMYNGEKIAQRVAKGTDPPYLKVS